MQVPKEILDFVSECAQKIIKHDDVKRNQWFGEGENRDEALCAAAEEFTAGVESRREIHRKILEELASRVTAGPGEGQSKLIYFCGPMAAGKSTLREKFDARIEAEGAGEPFEAFADEYQDGVFEEYKAAKPHAISSDFEVFKKHLFPKASGEFADNYNVIRAEASALDQAVKKWAAQAGYNLIQEHASAKGMGATVTAETESGFNMTVIGVTADPAVNAARLHERNKGQKSQISDEELLKRIRNFSHEEGFPSMIEHAPKIVLLSSKPAGQYDTVLAAQDGEVLHENTAAYTDFLDYERATASDLVPQNDTSFDLERAEF